MFAPIDEPAIVILLDVDSALPLTIIGSFRPRLRPMWPARARRRLGCPGTPTRTYDSISDETGRFAGVIGSPSAERSFGDAVSGGASRRAAPLRRSMWPPSTPRRQHRFRSLSPAHRRRARRRARRPNGCLGRHAGRSTSAPRNTTSGSIENTGAGRRRRTRGSTRHSMGASRDRQRAGDQPLARHRSGRRLSHVGRQRAARVRLVLRPRRAVDALALTASGDFDTARTALASCEIPARGWEDPARDLAERVARAVVHRLSVRVGQRRCDAAVRDRPRRSTGAPPAIAPILEQYWPSIVKAYRFSAATDTDGNGLIDNSGVGHGWVEGGALYPPHEEIYLQGLWIEASRSFAETGRRDAGCRAGARHARAPNGRARRSSPPTGWPTASHLRVRDVQAAHHAAGRGARAGARTAAAAPRRARERRDSSTKTRCCPRCRCGGARSTRRAPSAARSPRQRRDGHRLGPPHPLRPERAVRSALVSLRLGLAAVHRLGVDGGVPLRPSARRLPGADGQRAAHRIRRARLRHRAAVRRSQRGVRALVAPPGLVGSDGRDAARPRPARDRAARRRHAASHRAAAACRLGSRRRAADRGGWTRRHRDHARRRDADDRDGRASRRGGSPALLLAPALPLDARSIASSSTAAPPRPP